MAIAASHKGTLAFILNPINSSTPLSPSSHDHANALTGGRFEPGGRVVGLQRGPPSCTVDASTSYPRTRPSAVLVSLVRKKRRRRPHRSTVETRKKKKCEVPDCPSFAVSRSRCVRHGGGGRCTFPGCTRGAKMQTKCFQHGGSTTCLEDGCQSKAKRYGYCWSHGGGRICTERGCSKVAAQGGFCWAHGGGNRCRTPGCALRSYQKFDYFCKRHARDVEQTGSD